MLTDQVERTSGCLYSPVSTTSNKRSFSTLINDDNSGGRNVQHQKLSKRWHQTKVLPKPTTVKCDIRNQYANIFNNAVNNSDLSMVLQFFTRFARPSTAMVYSCADVDKANFPPCFIIAGSSNIYSYYIGMFRQFPDLVSSLKGFKIVGGRAQKGSKVIATFEGIGTKLFQLPVPEWLPTMRALKGQVSLDSIVNRKEYIFPRSDSYGVQDTRDETVSLLAIDCCNYDEQEHFSSSVMKLPQTPMPAPVKCLHFTSTITFHLSEDNIIELLEKSTHVISYQPVTRTARGNKSNRKRIMLP